MKTPRLSLLFLAAPLFLHQGCASPDPRSVRKDEARRFRAALEGKVEEERIPPGPLTLKECLRLAMKRNFSLLEARLRAEIAGLEARALEESLLLPRVDVSLVHSDRSNKPLVASEMGGREVEFPVMDKRIRVIQGRVSFPLLDLSRWFLSAQAKRGAEVGKFLVEAARQGVIAGVTARYGALAALESALPALQARVKADTLALEDQERRVKEGLALPQERDRAALELARSRDRLESLKREILQARRDLEQFLGFPPSGRIRIEPSFRVDVPRGGLEDLVFHALLERPELFAADRQVLAAGEKARAALSDFLPKVLLDFGLQTTTDSAQVHKFWAFGGLTALVNLFEGFAGISRLKGARRGKELALLERRELYGTVILQVVRAWKDYRDALEAEARARESLDLAGKIARRGRRLFKEGYLDRKGAAALDALVEGAKAALKGASVRRKVAACFLRLAVGPAGDGRKAEKKEGKDEGKRR